ncbi:metal ABC transporter ATP-binding protein [Marinobacterium rhizophilum]|uniref:Metal ABC transporter ATP-binding protein n=1 Tax=Marinobacterium rhizophilum TaxID=420402 RepID=A0ABY5HNW5_9GAMM|nr:metal ABC transporter ATP-binding protein [Marinobacterium rhizophilum]UTW12890.1 metal ABC transporter ATP-binding protein [Marinobacterium rhizophilum]
MNNNKNKHNHENAALIRVQDLSVQYANGLQALERVSFELRAGTICALVGSNGCGKSTLFKSIMGFLKPSCGAISLGGREIRRALKMNLVSYVPQSEDVDWDFPVLVDDVVMMGRYGHMGFLRRASREDRLHVDQALERVGMSGYRKRQIGELSGGQRKRVFLARALAQGGQIILLDEPFTGVDIGTETAIIELLQALRGDGHLLLVSTHNLGSVPAYCDQALLLNRTLVAAGPTAQVFTDANLQRVFGGPLATLPPALAQRSDDMSRCSPGAQTGAALLSCGGG